MAIIPGVGFLIANDILTDVSYALLQPSVKTTVPVGGIATGTHTVLAWSPAMFVGAQLVVGTVNGDAEVVTITAIVAGSSFTATFANTHSAGEPITGATFPVRQPTDPLFNQAEMLSYLSTAANDFLTDCPIVYAVNNSISVPPTQQSTPLPADCMWPARVAYNDYPLRETSQSNLDALMWRWNQQAISEPTVYFRDKVPVGSVGVWPRAGNTTPLEVVYTQRQSSTGMGLADGFLIPDPFLIYVLYKTLSYAFSKDGEARNPGLAKYFQTRYDWGVKISQMFLESLMDPNLQLG